MLPHSPPKFMGITGISLPSTIRIIPRWNSAICPVLVSSPSGKMQTNSPAWAAWRAVFKAVTIPFGPMLGLM